MNIYVHEYITSFKMAKVTSWHTTKLCGILFLLWLTVRIFVNSNIKSYFSTCIILHGVFLVYLMQSFLFCCRAVSWALQQRQRSLFKAKLSALPGRIWPDSPLTQNDTIPEQLLFLCSDFLVIPKYFPVTKEKYGCFPKGINIHRTWFPHFSMQA